jgi:small subunit ribosomal protein S16
MLKIRLQRFGKKKKPIYRIVAIESSIKRDGKPVERLGFYNPHTKELMVNKARVEYWVSNGAQMSETVAGIMKRGITHDLAEGPYKFETKSRESKEEHKVKLKEANSKIGKAEKKKREAEAKKKADEEAAKAEAEAKAKEEAAEPAA